MIVTFWLYAASLLDTPERKIKMEARRIAEVLEKYNNKKNPLSKYLLKRFIFLLAS